jgi:hypothetical protein
MNHNRSITGVGRLNLNPGSLTLEMTKMKKFFSMLTVALVVAPLSLIAAEAVKSGPQVGERVPGPFHPLNVNGKTAGEKACLFCRHSGKPVAMVFARDINPTTVALIKKLDNEVVKNKEHKMGSFVVFLGETEALESRLKDVVKKEKISNCEIAIDNAGGPEGYNVAPEADVTIVLYSEGKVKANHSFKKGALTEKDIETVVKELPKILE